MPKRIRQIMISMRLHHEIDRSIGFLGKRSRGMVEDGHHISLTSFLSHFGLSFFEILLLWSVALSTAEAWSFKIAIELIGGIVGGFVNRWDLASSAVGITFSLSDWVGLNCLLTLDHRALARWHNLKKTFKISVVLTAPSESVLTFECQHFLKCFFKQIGRQKNMFMLFMWKNN